VAVVRAYNYRTSYAVSNYLVGTGSILIYLVLELPLVKHFSCKV